MPTRLPPAAAWVILGVVLLAGAFQWGVATAASSFGARRRTLVVEAVDHAARAVVSIDAWSSRQRTRGEGSGVFVHPAGIVVTNSHVIRGADRITLEPFRSGRPVRARVIADDPGGDLALLQVEGGATWPYVSLAPSGEVMLGETAVAIGNPRGLGDSITVGVVSAVRRSAKLSNGGTIRNLIQTDASINSGNSGGPLLNLDGELIGINASILPRATGIAFAISADDVQALLVRALGHCAPRNTRPEEGVEDGPQRPPTSGGAARPPVVAPRSPAPPPTTFQDDGGEGRQATVPLLPGDLGLDVRDDGRRLVVTRVTPASSAAGAGLRPGDVLLDIDGLPAEDLDDVILAFQASRPGRRYLITVRRGSTQIVAIMVSPR